MDWEITGKIIDIAAREIYSGRITVRDNRVLGITRTSEDIDQYILPGFIDAHVHVESSMLVPAEFARLAVPHGTVATVSDPHEIGNVLGVKGVEYMIENGDKVNFKFFFGAPSCVPATPFETSGAVIDVEDIDKLLQNPDIKYLAEMMNWPGVLNQDKEVLDKIKAAKKHKKPVDGHAPGIKGEQAKIYAHAGISTDHECFTEEEALAKLSQGMKILIREGSAAKNFEALISLIDEYPGEIMFCSDDKHPDDLVEGHINLLVKRALKKGHDLFHVLQAACISPVKHYGLEVGLLQPGDPADFIVVDNPSDFNVLTTVIDGKVAAEKGTSKIKRVKSSVINNFKIPSKKPADFKLAAGGEKIKVMEALDGQLITKFKVMDAHQLNGAMESDPDKDLLKISVVNRYKNTQPSVGFIHNFGLREGAIASSVGHDSHNIVAVGTSDEAICRAVNLIIDSKGGIAAVGGNGENSLPLPVAGLMSTEDGYEVAKHYSRLDQMAKRMGSKLASPFMTLSFMALLVIPHLKISDKGLFDADKFELTDIFV